jgi:hypothetical protein
MVFIEEYRTPQQFVQVCIDFLKNASQNYTVPRWYKQPHYVEVWIEKLALADTFSSFLKGRDVRITVNRGYSGWSDKIVIRICPISKSWKKRRILEFKR